jgi:short-chain fatty acids transporter
MLPADPPRPGAPSDDEELLLARTAARFTAWAERWIPDAFVFALVATFVVIAAAAASSRFTVLGVIDIWGGGFWKLLEFTLQMSLVIITGYVVATTRPVYGIIARIARIPRTPRGAVALVAAFAMVSSWVNWVFSLIFGAMLAKEVARRVSTVDYRAVAAASFLGLGSIWAQGLSGSAALQMATPGALPPEVRDVVAAGSLVPGGVIPFSKTVFLWQSLASVAIEISVVTLLVFLAAPTGSRARTAAKMGIVLGASPAEHGEPERRGTPGEWLEHSPVLSVLLVALGGTYLVRYFTRATGGVLNAINLSTINLLFLLLGVALHGTPARLMRAVKEATPGVWAVILQFPFYAGIAAVITKTELNERIAGWFVGASSPRTFPALIALYSAALGIFVPSGGSKWVIEAPYVIRAAHELKVNLGWMVSVYDLGEALANLVQPFWMLPILALFGLRARDVMGYTLLVFMVLLPLVLVMVTLLGATLPYPL